jgi:hypothetical protein
LRLLRWLSLAIFLLAFVHTSLVVGMIHQVPLGGPVHERFLEQTQGPLVTYPAKVYGLAGRAMWRSGYVDRVLTQLYRPLVQKVGEEAGARTALRIVDVGLWNAVTLVGLALTILFFLIPGKKKRPSRLYV